MDKLKHFALCFAVTGLTDLVCHFIHFSFIGWLIGAFVGVTVEATQAEYGNATVKQFIKKFFSKDSLLDLLADALGIIVAIGLRIIIGMF